jgi:flagellar hook-associated protein 2
MTSNIINTLGAGSGIDVKALAENLVEATRAPLKQRLDQQIEKAQARISGYSAVKFAVQELKTAFEKLNDASDFSSLKVNNSQSSAFGLVPSATAAAGSYSIGVQQTAKAQRTASMSFAERSTVLNGGAAFTLQLQKGAAAAQDINVTNATPAGMVSAINGAKLGVTAQLINTGSGHQIVLTGETGAANAFTMSTSATGPAAATVVQADENGVNVQAGALASAVSLSYPDPNDASQTVSVALEKQLDGSWTLPAGASALPAGVTATATAVQPLTFSQSIQTAQDALLNVNGLQVTRSTNSINDVIEGVTVNLFTETTGTAQVDMNRDTASIKDSLKNLVAAHKDFEDTLRILGDRESEVEQFGGALAGDSLLNSVRSQVRNMFTALSTTPGETVQAARHVGLEFDKLGVLQLNETKLDEALQTRFDEVVTMFSAGTNNQSVTSPSPAGLAGEAVKRLDKMLRFGNVIDDQSKRASDQVLRYEADLEKHEERMQKLLERYTTQFSVMESIVGQSNSMRSSLKGSFEGMMAMYKN